MNNATGLGNVPRRNMNAEDKAIVRRLKAYDEREKENLAAGMGEAEASKDAFEYAKGVK